MTAVVHFRVFGAGYKDCNGCWGIDPKIPRQRDGVVLYKKIKPDGTFYEPGTKGPGSRCLSYIKNKQGWMFYNMGDRKNDWPYYCPTSVYAETPPSAGWLRHECEGALPVLECEGIFIMKKTLALGKLIASAIRVVFEDLYNSFCQSVYLCKIWLDDDVNNFTRAFVVSSIAAGITCSLLGPIIECRTLCMLGSGNRQGASMFGDCEDYLRAEEFIPLELEETSSPLIGSAHESPEDCETGTPRGQQQDTTAADVCRQASMSSSRRIQVDDMSVRRFLLDKDNESSRRARKALMVGATLYWGSNAAIYFLLDIECEGAIPKPAWLIFLGMTTVVVVIEIWILIHCRQGYLLFKHLRTPFFLGILFGTLGRFDTFGDVTNSVAIIACAAEDPEHYSWFEIWGHRFSIGTDLGTHMKISVVMIVLLQMLPGLILLFRKKWIPIALKLNEFALILKAMEQETTGGEDDVEES